MKLTDNEEIMTAIRTLAGHQLKLLDLARQAVKKDGTLDTDWLAMHHKEVDEAADEAEAYAQEVSEALDSLKALAKGS